MDNILILVWDVFTFLFIFSDKGLIIQTKTHDMLKIVPPIEHIPQKNAKIQKNYVHMWDQARSLYRD